MKAQFGAFIDTDPKTGKPVNLLSQHIQKIKDLYSDVVIHSKTEDEYYKEISLTVYITLQATYAKVVKELIILWLAKLHKTTIKDVDPTWKYRVTVKYHPLLFNARKENEEGELIVQMRRDDNNRRNNGRRNNRNNRGGNKGRRRNNNGRNNKGRARPQQRG